MLSRYICRHLHPHLRSAVTLALASSSSSSSHHPLFPPPPPPPRFASPISFLQSWRSLSTGDGGDGWNFRPRGDEEEDSVFGGEDDLLSGISEIGGDTFGSERAPAPAPAPTSSGIDDANDIFAKIDKEVHVAEKTGDDWETAEGYKPWEFGDDDDDEKVDAFGIKIGGGGGGGGGEGIEGIGGVNVDELLVDDKEGEEKRRELEMREQELATTLKGPNRAFGDLIAASGITEEMIDSLILLKDTRGIPGLPPLSVIEDKAIARMNAPSIRGEIERKKQEEIQKARVRQVDEKGRAYGTGRRKCSVARVWIQPGDGKFVVNDKQFDAYFPILDHRAELLRPFTVTKTLGLWDVNCTVKGGGVSGQVGAIRLGVSRALQNWEPGLRPYLKSAGYLTRDPRVVERKKPGKAKARKSFQWVKR